MNMFKIIFFMLLGFVGTILFFGLLIFGAYRLMKILSPKTDNTENDQDQNQGDNNNEDNQDQDDHCDDHHDD